MDPNKKDSNVYRGGTNNEHGKRTSKNGKHLCSFIYVSVFSQQNKDKALLNGINPSTRFVLKKFLYFIYGKA